MIDQCSEVQAIRKFLGLEIKEAAALVGYSVRSWQYWEKGEQIAPQEILQFLDCFCSFTKNMLELTATANFKSLPYFIKYEEFCSAFPFSPTKYKWQLWQRIVGLARINHHCEELTNSGAIDEESQLYKRFNEYFISNKR